MAGVVLLLSATAWAGGVYRQTKHGDPVNGVQRLTDESPGECSQCHDEHASRQGAATSGPWPYLLFASDDNALCYTCHNISGSLSIYQGSVPYGNSSHGLSSTMVWPGPTPPGRSSSDAGKCVNCHDAHGASDASGQIPAMTFAREEALCNACHNGSVARADVASEFRKLYRHPIELTGRHSEAEGADPAKFAAAPVNNRHSECADCHNSHVAQPDSLPPAPPSASNRLLGVSRIRVLNGPAGARPAYTYSGPGDLVSPNEYELCFKCHSSWTTLPLGLPDLAVLFNPANPSFHPVEAAGKNNIHPGAFANGWDSMRMAACTDCHSSDDGVRGAHGSSYEHILKKSYPVVTGSPSSSTDLCFDCHNYSVYGDPNASGTVQAESRFNMPKTSGHAFHAGSGVRCYACHESHGSATLPALIFTGRNPGVVSYSQSSSGGTCLPTCHSAATYTVNYAR
jgi:predicted CXXCH cytochrome family protein